MKFSHSVFSAKKNDASLKFYLKKITRWWKQEKKRKTKRKEEKFMYQHCNDMTETWLLDRS